MAAATQVVRLLGREIEIVGGNRYSEVVGGKRGK